MMVEDLNLTLIDDMHMCWMYLVCSLVKRLCDLCAVRLLLVAFAKMMLVKICFTRTQVLKFT